MSIRCPRCGRDYPRMFIAFGRPVSLNRPGWGYFPFHWHHWHYWHHWQDWD